MLYEPPKTKKYLIIGAIAVILAFLVVVAIPFFFKGKTSKTPTANFPLNPQQQKIQKEQDKMIEAAKKQKDSAPSAEQLQKDSNRLIGEAKPSGTKKSPEEIRKDQDNLISATKK